jgi:hypothetical protein
MVLLYGNVQALLQDMKTCLHLMELSEAIKPEDTRVAHMMAALRKRIEEVERLQSSFNDQNRWRAE